MKRRGFIQTTLVGIAGATLPPIIDSKVGSNQKGMVSLSSDNMPVADNTDVLVCGGGSAGCAAAITAARKGVSVRLIELTGALGGNLTVGLVNNIIDSENKTGFVKEFENTMTNRGGRYSNKVDPELAKIVLEEMCESAGMKLRYHTLITGAVVDKNKRLIQVITESKAGKEAWKAKALLQEVLKQSHTIFPFVR